ncbi:MAG: hypothetical protein AAF649_07940, partial [Verrucomicrobiota bacterium]
MPDFRTGFLLVALPCAIWGQEPSMLADPKVMNAQILAELPVKTVAVELEHQTFFTDRVATAIVYFDTVVYKPQDTIHESDSVRVIEIEVFRTAESEKGVSAAIIRFLPKRSGIALLPVLEFSSETTRYVTKPLQILVSEPTRSDAMSLHFKPEKQQVYVGEPVRVDLHWENTLNADTLRALRLNPSFFENPGIEVVIPRSTDPEELRVGLPIGGRRVIARREKNPDNADALGKITLPIYLRFTKAGIFTLDSTRLEIAQFVNGRFDFGRYKAYFNNGFFEAIDPRQLYQRIYTFSEPVTIEVRPLPEAPVQHFSGLFDPLHAELTVKPTEVEIGQLMQLEIKLSGNAPHGMLELPQLSRMANLHERFLLDENHSRLWHENGSIFRVRFRILSTSVQAFPSLQIPVFNPQSGTFTILQTEAIPLQVSPSDGEDFIPLDRFKGATVELTPHQQGIWHNLRKQSTVATMNFLYELVRIGFWPLLLAGPILFTAALPMVLERRRLTQDPGYRKRQTAYRAFKHAPGKPSAKWQAFLRFLEAVFDFGTGAWTRSDSRDHLRSIGLPARDIDTVLEMHANDDQASFGKSSPAVEFKSLDSIARKIVRLASNSMIALALFGVAAIPAELKADSWSEGKALFAEAQVATNARHLYIEAAFQFEAAVHEGSQQGEAWTNAGNAWFQAGALGRAIAAYHHAAYYRPFDTKLQDNLSAARALTLNEVPPAESVVPVLPVSWLKMSLILFNLLFWSVALWAVFSRRRNAIFTCSVTLFLLIINVILFLHATTRERKMGVIVVDTVYAKKGPDYAYANAFNEPLHDGLEFILLETRGEWGLIELSDTRQAWIPIQQAHLL